MPVRTPAENATAFRARRLLAVAEVAADRVPFPAISGHIRLHAREPKSPAYLKAESKLSGLMSAITTARADVQIARVRLVELGDDQRAGIGPEAAIVRRQIREIDARIAELTAAETAARLDLAPHKAARLRAIQARVCRLHDDALPEIATGLDRCAIISQRLNILNDIVAAESYRETTAVISPDTAGCIGAAPFIRRDLATLRALFRLPPVPKHLPDVWEPPTIPVCPADVVAARQARDDAAALARDTLARANARREAVYAAQGSDHQTAELVQLFAAADAAHRAWIGFSGPDGVTGAWRAETGARQRFNADPAVIAHRAEIGRVCKAAVAAMRDDLEIARAVLAVVDDIAAALRGAAQPVGPVESRPIIGLEHHLRVPFIIRTLRNFLER